MRQCYSFMVTLGWVIGRPLGLLFDPFESVVSAVSSLTFTKFICLLHRCSISLVGRIFIHPLSRISQCCLVQTMNHVVADGKSNWLEGIILIGEDNG